MMGGFMARVKGKGKGRGKRGKKRKVGEERIVVRLMGEGQYYIDKDILREVNRIDNQMVKMLRDERVDEHAVIESIAAMRSLVKIKGKRVKDDIIIPSHIIIPTTDISVEEAREVFKGEGIIPEGILD
ncbi:MAG: hypothetical protein QXM95_01615 [Candidatus Nitrosocaldus sp.]